MEQQIIKKTFRFKGFKLSDREYDVLCQIAYQKFYNEGLTQFDCKLRRGKSLRIKFVRSSYTKVNGCPQVNIHFKVTPEVSYLRLEQMIKKLRSQIKLREKRKSKRSERGGEYYYKAHTCIS